MKRLLPSAGELALFGVIAVACAAIASRFAAPEIGLAVIAMPLFVVACVRGLLKHGHLSRREAVRVEAETSKK